MNAFNLGQLNKWVARTSLNALEDAYQGALAIKKIEDTHFGGDAIAVTPGQGKTVSDYFRTQLERQLLRIRANLLRFKVASFIVNRPATRIEPQDTSSEIVLSEQTAEAIVIEKLAFIESVVSKYRDFNNIFSDFFAEIFSDKVPTVTPEVLGPDNQDLNSEQTPIPDLDAGIVRSVKSPKVVPGKARSIKNNKQGLEPVRLFGGAERIGKEFSPKYEQEVIQELRVLRLQNRMAVRWLIVPIVTQVLTKNLILNPILGDYFEQNPTKVELSTEIQEEFLREFSEFRETLEIKRLIAKAIVEEEEKGHKSFINTPEEEAELASALFGEIPEELVQDLVGKQPGQFRSLLITTGWTEVEQELEEKALQEKAIDLWREARQRQLEGVKNVLADCVAMLAFVAVVFFGRNRLAVLRNFTNRSFLNLNDPTKVFLFILVTDMFVGFHSAEGWEVVLEGIGHHWGLPESKVLINGFIATVPVIADAGIKFWIFNYLTRYSPAASAIYERMNT
jgi:CemA family